MHRSLFHPWSLVFLLFLFTPHIRACETPCNNCYPAPTGTTHITGISPGTALAGVGYVYVNGYCFGDAQGTGTVAVNGETMNAVVLWSDAEIIFVLPFDAKSGDLKVTSASYGSDDSAYESTLYTVAKVGNGAINASFAVVTPQAPPYCCVPNTNPPAPYVTGAPSVPQYVSGTWDYNQGPNYVETLTLTQGGQNPDGSWPVTGTDQENPGPCGTLTLTVTGTLDQYGDLVLRDDCSNEFREWRILGSGDITSQGYGGIGCYALAASQYGQFFQLMSTEAEGPFYYCERPPLFREGTNVPSAETPTAGGWEIKPYSGSQHPTFGAWKRIFPTIGGFVGYAGRFVYEQSGTGATDTCWTSGSITDQVIGVTGGGWWVDQNGDWEWDAIGMWGQGVSWYQANQPNLPCQFSVAQRMLIDGRTGQAQYTTNQLTFQIQLTKIYSEVQPGVGPLVKECENYPSLKGNCKP